jgi:quercetin dioxygenase-like cupin family protein
MKLRDDLTTFEHVPFESTPWTPSPEANVDRKMLERDGGEVARATSIVRYGKHSAFPEHTHERGEEFIVLAGTFSDEHGSYAEGTYVRNPPGSAHRPFSEGGCTLFVKLRQFDRRDTRRCVIPLETESAEAAGSTSSLLHAFGDERVSLVRLAGGATMDLDGSTPGFEIFVLHGSMSVDGAHGNPWTWVRSPRGTARLRSPTGCAFWLKQGHLSRPPTWE